MKTFLIALQFLTIFPVHLKAMPTKRQNAQSLLFYPFIGLVIGLILFAIATILQALPNLLVSSLLLVSWICITGGLHLDGLADTADAWIGGYGDKERTLAIMKDPNCGPIAVLSLILVCVLKWSAIYILLEQELILALILFPLLGRLTPLFLFLTTNYVRDQGLGSSLATYMPKISTMIIFVWGLSVAGYFEWSGILTALIFVIILGYLRHKFIQRIGGITGDTIGASIEICETMTLLSFVILSLSFKNLGF